MHVNAINVMRRRNLGNYEHFEVALSASLEENDNFEESYNALLDKLKLAMGGRVAEKSKPEAQEAPAPKKTAKKVAKKASTKKKAPAKKAAVAKEDTYTVEDLLPLCRDTANKLGSADKVKELINTACGVSSIKEADPSTFSSLKKLLEDAVA